MPQIPGPLGGTKPGPNEKTVRDVAPLPDLIRDPIGFPGPGKLIPPNKGHKKQHKKVRRNLCDQPPAAPTGVVLTFKAREALTHLRFHLKVRWNRVTTDADGFRLLKPGITAYEVQYIATDVAGVPVDIEDLKTNFRVREKQPVNQTAITAATIITGTTARFTTRRNHGFNAGDKVLVEDMTPTAYNGSWTVSATGLTANQFRADIGASPGDGTKFGTVYDDDDHLHIISGTLPRPKTLYWKARVRARDSEQRWSEWSPWTAPGLPWTGADPEPPAPSFPATPIAFDRVGRDKPRRLRLKLTFNEVVNWDVPGGDREDDVHSYVVVIDRSDDGTTWDGTPWYRKKVISAKQDDDADTTRTVHFFVGARQWYRAKVRTIDRYGHRGDWSAWTDAAFPGDNTRPPQPQNVRIFDNAVDRIILDWAAPTEDFPVRGTVSGTSGTATLTGTNTKFTIDLEAGARVKVGGNTYRVKKVTSDTALTLTTNLSTSPSGATLYEVEEHHDVHRYKAQIAKASDVDETQTPDDWNDVYDAQLTVGTRAAFKIPEADQDLSFNGRVLSMDMARNRSRWVPGKVTPNSDPDADGDSVSLGVTVDNAKRRHFITWTVPGTVQVKHYDALWTADRKYRLIKARARCGRHVAANHPADDGTPGGSALQANLRWHSDDESQDLPLMDAPDRLKIPANSHKDTVWASEFNIQSINEHEAFSLKVPVVGDTRPGKNLVVTLVVEEDQEDEVLNVGGLTAYGAGRGTMAATVV